MSKTLVDALEEIRQLKIIVAGKVKVIDGLNARIEKNGKKLESLVKRNTRLKWQRDGTRLEVDKRDALLIKLRDGGQFFHSAIELESYSANDVDGEKLLAEIEALVGPKVRA